MGVTNETSNFNPAMLYQPMHELDSLQSQFSQEEILQAVCQLANNKAFGPDWLTNEFVKHYWEIINKDILEIFDRFYNHDIDLSELNKANIVMVAKKGGS